MRFFKPLVLTLGLAISSAAMAQPVPDGKMHKFASHDANFYIDDQPVRLLCGEIDPGRIPPELWDDRIKKAKAMGLNTISPYLYWNEIEPQEGKFVFDGFSDVRKFVKTCQDDGMWVLLRPGPYICGEWEMGGFPAWLLTHKGIGLRANEPQFLDFSRQYIEKLHDQVGDLQVTHGGPILLVQFENEDHSADSPYMRAVHDIFVNAGFDTQLMTCDPGAQNRPPWNVDRGIPGVLRGYNGFTSGTQARYDRSTEINKAEGYPVLSPEVYTGWFDTWGPVGKSPFVSVAQQVKDTQWLLDHKNLSWSYYVFDGGTNWGYMGGANHGTPMQTSYDYDAPVDEMGRMTPKYMALRDLIGKTLKLDLPPLPPDPNIIEIPAFTLQADSTLLDHAANAVNGEHALSMEQLGQNYGFVDYRKSMSGGIKGTLNLAGTRDYAIVMIDGKVVGEAFNGYGRQSFMMKLDHDGPCVLDILVHNLGRDSLLSAPPPATLTKGMTADPTLDGTALTGWDMFSMPLDTPPDDLPIPTAASSAHPLGMLKQSPALYKGTFTVADRGETYLDMSNWHFGVVWVNGHNLGRYWDVGDCRSLYLPSAWQNVGDNKIEVLELGTPPTVTEIKGVKDMVRTSAKRFSPLWVKAG
jgi:beta-galactosidase